MVKAIVPAASHGGSVGKREKVFACGYFDRLSDGVAETSVADAGLFRTGFADWRLPGNPQTGDGWPAFQAAWRHNAERTRALALATTGAIPELKIRQCGAVFPGGTKFGGGVLTRDGRVFLFPRAAQAMIYDPAADALCVPNVPDTLTGYIGGCLLRDGRVLMVPYFADAGGIVRVYDPVSDTLSRPAGAAIGNCHIAAQLLPNGDALITTDGPTQPYRYIAAEDRVELEGGWDTERQQPNAPQLMPDGRLFMAPAYLGTHAFIYDPAARTSRIIDAVRAPANHAYMYAVLLCDGRIFIPAYYDFDHLVYDPAADAVKTIPQAQYLTGRMAGNPLPDGRVAIFSSTHVDNVQVFDPLDGDSLAVTDVRTPYAGFEYFIHLLDGSMFSVPRGSTRALALSAGLFPGAGADFYTSPYFTF